MILITISKSLLLLFLGYFAYTDGTTRKVGLLPLAAAFVSGAALQITAGEIRLYELALGCAVGVVLVLISYLSRGALGMGDALLFITSGAFLGIRENIFLLFFSLVLAAVFSAVMLIFRKRSLKDSFPFAPFILGGYVCVLSML